jgi:hypothetical protein
VRLFGTAQGVTFDWTTFGLKITSTIAEFVPHTRIGWYGTGDQLRAYHTWLLIPRNGNSTYVVMEEIEMGRAARHLAQTNPGHMHRGHELWISASSSRVKGNTGAAWRLGRLARMVAGWRGCRENAGVGRQRREVGLWRSRRSPSPACCGSCAGRPG